MYQTQVQPLSLLDLKQQIDPHQNDVVEFNGTSHQWKNHLVKTRQRNIRIKLHNTSN